MEYPFQYKQFWCQSCCQTLPSWFSYLHERKSKVQWQGAQGGPWLRTVKELRPWIQQSLRNRILPTTKVSLEAVLSPVKLLEETSTLADYLTVVLWETLKWRRPSLAAFVTYRYGPNKCMMSKLLRSDNVSNGNRPKKKNPQTNPQNTPNSTEGTDNKWRLSSLSLIQKYRKRGCMYIERNYQLTN